MSGISPYPALCNNSDTAKAGRIVTDQLVFEFWGSKTAPAVNAAADKLIITYSGLSVTYSVEEKRLTQL